MQIAVLEGYRGVPRGRRTKMRRGKHSLRKRMKRCAKHHKVTSKGFWTCVRKGRRR